MDFLKKYYLILWIIANWLIVAGSTFVYDVLFRGEALQSELFKQTFIYLPGFLIIILPFTIVELINAKKKQNRILRCCMMGAILAISIFSTSDTIIRIILKQNPTDVFEKTFNIVPSDSIKIAKCIQKRNMNEASFVFFINAEKNEIINLMKKIGISSNDKCQNNRLSKEKAIKKWLDWSNKNDLEYFSTSFSQNSKIRYINIVLSPEVKKCVIETHY